ncbi:MULTISPECIES: hypothetical protein [Moorena]|uniref:hypothetical protein n=1 Tax=Moorena TaxID=1155738 RepID=UPI0010554AC2|nr:MULTISPECIES: hypothetical protein [Moorena]NEQ13735.1 hypothetical protein [Moorena sp. SIO3E2]NEP33795.1 hypothetical protein [Moorena sp. SIO3B2]NEP64704.1 hypothetical protein [Moorena sp. SIO3A5]NEQ07953.1 hypothetical protein [Moorena sp. SIO4E2]NER85800.1 hypothetical protein [Moorena sp. SIO3A2]
MQQTNQISSPSHPKALPTNCLEIETGKMPVLPRCPFHWVSIAVERASCPPQHILKLARCQFHYNRAIDVGWAVQQTNQISSPSHPKALPTNCPPTIMNDKGAR